MVGNMGTATGTETKPRQKPKEKVVPPRRYKVILHNDNYTTMDFVVEVLEHVFQKPRDEAVRIMLAVHHNGLGVAGVYIKSIAEAKAETTQRLARAQGFPLRCSVEPE